MFKLLVSSMVALTTFAQLPEYNQFSEIIKEISDVQTCSECDIELCDNTIILPNDLLVGSESVTCEYIDNIIIEIKEGLFKNSKDCEGKVNEYICEVFVIPFGKLTKDACSNQDYDSDLLEEIYEESFCEANENCEDLSRCSMYNFDCEYDSDILPFIGESASIFDEGECPHNDFSQKVKRFFKKLGPQIITAITTNSLLLIMIFCIFGCYMKCCRKERRYENRNDVENV